MSDKEQDEIIGRLVRECSTFTQEREVIKADLYSRGGALHRLGERLTSYAFDDAQAHLDRLSESMGSDLMVLKQKMHEYQELNKKITGLTDQLIKLGIKQ